MKKFNLLKVLVMMMVVALLICGCAKNEETKQGYATTAGNGEEVQQQESEAEDSTEELLSGKYYVNIIIKDKGTISVELDADMAPITVTNFVKLAKDGFYDGLTFHRIIDTFMMQGGDPTGTGTGGSEETIKGEFSQNGVANSLSHTRGAISMARSQRYDSASSQFFIVHQDSTYLDGQYACFGYVTEGMDIVDDICENTTGQDGNGFVPEENRPVIETIEVVE